ncbi:MULTISPECIES: DcrB-related protein [Pseudescherichia]|uniref:DcrB-related protein n=1 Tax=Pseudescherichia TaxID=2055880 RepID=UPI001EE0FD9C|nr:MULTISPECIES: DcrB-related protein [Pseudescherichia]
MRYTLQEGTFSLFPAAWQDTSMTILRDDESGLSVVVSRGTIPEGSDAEKEFQRQRDMLRTQMEEITQSDFQRVTVGAGGNIPATEVETTFERSGQRLWQRQLAVQVPDKPVLMIFTLSALRPFTNEDGERWDALKQTLTLNSTRTSKS